MAHEVDDERADDLPLVLGHLDEDLVVDLQHEPALEPALLQRGVDAHQGDLEDVGGEALDAGVHRLALARPGGSASCR